MGAHFADLLLFEINQRPIGFHGVLKLAVGGVGALKGADGGKQAVAVVCIARGGVGQQQGSELLLVDAVGGAAQRRCEPAVVAQIHAGVRFAAGGHPHPPAGGLDAENGGQIVLVEHFRPSAVGQYHHFADQRVDGRTALALGHGYAAVFLQPHAVVVAFDGVFFVAVALFLQFLRQREKVSQIGMVGKGAGRSFGSAGAGFAVKQRLDGLDTQIAADGHALDAAAGIGSLKIGADVEINAEGGADMAFV